MDRYFPKVSIDVLSERKKRVGYVSEEKLSDICYSPGYSESVSFIKISEKLEGG